MQRRGRARATQPEADEGRPASARGSPAPAKRPGPPEAEVRAGRSAMRSARERPEVESQPAEVAPPGVLEEAPAGTPSRANVGGRALWDGGVTVREFEPESESEWESESEEWASEEELEKPEPEGLPTRVDRVSLQVTEAHVASRAHLLDPDQDVGEPRARRGWRPAGGGHLRVGTRETLLARSKGEGIPEPY